MACNVTRMKEHLKTCEAYLEDPTNAGSCIVDEHNRKRQRTGIQAFVSITGVKRQSRLEVPTLSNEEQEAINRMAAMALYKTGGGFSNFEDEDYAAFLHRLNPAYKIPSARLFSGRLLDEAYDTVRGELQVVLDKCTYFNFVTDGSSNKRHDCIVNLSIHTEIVIFQLESQIIPSIKHTAEELARWADERANFWSRGAITKHNSWATDTASVMRSFWSIMGKKPAWERSFFVPCDSHGIQLLMKHISELNWFSTTLKRAQQIAIFFHKAEKQLAILREEQIKQNGRTYALTLSVITRWGTQYRLLHSLSRSKEALRHYSVRNDLDISGGAEGRNMSNHHQVLRNIADHRLWDDIEDLLEILKKLHKCQVMSESSHAHLGLVVQRWHDIENHLRSLKNRPGFARSTEIESIFQPRIDKKGRQNKSVWKTQYEKQVIDIHFVAYHLDPNKCHVACNGPELPLVSKFLDSFTNSTDEDKRIETRRLFHSFKRRQHEFIATAPLWASAKNPVLFWMEAAYISPRYYI